jgi:hypothetical protein
VCRQNSCCRQVGLIFASNNHSFYNDKDMQDSQVDPTNIGRVLWTAAMKDKGYQAMILEKKDEEDTMEVVLRELRDVDLMSESLSRKFYVDECWLVVWDKNISKFPAEHLLMQKFATPSTMTGIMNRIVRPLNSYWGTKYGKDFLGCKLISAKITGVDGEQTWEILRMEAHVRLNREV